MICIQNLTYTYPKADQPALNDVSLNVDAGELVLLAGESGAGKSTLLRSLNGLVPHFSGGAIQGKVQVLGHDIIQLGPSFASKTIGFVFQDPETQNVMDRVEAEIAFGLENAAIPQREMRVRVDEVLNLLALGDLRHRSLNTLSGGERQRLAIATVLVQQPKILLLDEPTSQLDPQSADEVLGAIVRLNEELGLTVLLVEHRLERVIRYADRLVFMKDGMINVDAPVRKALASIKMDLLPPLARLARQLDFESIPLNTKEARQQLKHIPEIGGGTGRLDVVSDHSGQEERTKIGVQYGRSPVLEAKKLYFGYNGQAVLQGANLQIGRGEAVALIGRNGSGKSTLLKCLVGLISPEQGEIRISGRPINGMRVAEICQTVGYLPQAPDDLLFADSVIEEIQVTLDNHNLSSTDIRHSPRELLKDLGLDQLRDAYPRDLSVGQRQRVAIGAVTVTGPEILLLDEPTRGLDYGAKQKLIRMWRNWQSAGMALLLVTHDVELAARAADRILVLSNGEIIADGSTAEILQSSPLFSPQMVQLFPDSKWLTVDDVLTGGTSHA
jgi:energy-coupling factor transport system ATP-binding protein